MKRTLTTIALAVVLAAGPAAAITVDEIVARNLEARGGRKALDALQSLRVSGTLSLEDLQGPYTLEWKKPGQVRMSYGFHGMKTVEGFDGETGWSLTTRGGEGSPTRLSGTALERLKIRADYVEKELVDYRRKGHDVDLIDTVKVDGREAYKLRLKRAGGDTVILYVDTEHYLVFRSESKLHSHGSVIEVDSRIGSYKPVQGVLMAHSVVSTLRGGGGGGGAHGGQRQEIRIDSIEPGVAIDDARFAMPQAGREASR